MRVTVVGHQTEYSRTRVVRQALTQHTDIRTNVVDIQGEGIRSVSRQVRIFRAAMQTHRKTDVFVLPALNQKEILALWAASRATGKHLVTDMLISTYDTLVEDRQLLSPSAPRAMIARWLDRMACSRSDLLFCDTEAHATHFVETYGAERRRCTVVRVGAEAAFFECPKTTYNLSTPGCMTVLFYGGFSPLHGIPAIVDAARILDSSCFRFELVGKGQVWEEVRRSITEAGLDNVTLSGPVPYAELPRLIGSCDVGLGIFGVSAKAKRVIPNKVYQMTACGLPVVTMDSPAIREVFEPDHSIVTVSQVTGEKIAAALLRLHSSRYHRQRIGARGKQAAASFGHPQVIAQQLTDAFGQMGYSVT